MLESKAQREGEDGINTRGRRVQHTKVIKIMGRRGAGQSKEQTDHT